MMEDPRFLVEKHGSAVALDHALLPGLVADHERVGFTAHRMVELPVHTGLGHNEFGVQEKVLHQISLQIELADIIR